MGKDLKPELKRDLILSLGTHRSKRRLSPIEVAETIDALLKEGSSFSELAKLVQFDSTSTLREIHRLLRIAPDLRHLVGWGKQSSSTLSMTAASQVGRLVDQSDQMAAVEAILLHELSSEEARQLVETRIRSQRPMPECVETILKLRPRVQRKHLFIGAITSEKLSHHLQRITQSERDELLRNAVSRHIANLPSWSGKLGATRFDLFGGDDFGQIIKGLPNGFEATINAYLEAEATET